MILGLRRERPKSSRDDALRRALVNAIAARHVEWPRSDCGILDLSMRPFAATATLVFAVMLPAQTTQPSRPNAVRLTKYVLGVANLDRTHAFYHALGLELENATTLNKPTTLPEMLLKLVAVPAGTKFRNMMLKIPNTPFSLEVTEFSNMELRPVRPRIQDPGASLLVLSVGDVDAALAITKSFGVEVVTTGGSPVPVRFRGGEGRAVTVKDPDGYYVELNHPPDAPAGNAGIIGAGFIAVSVAQDVEKAASFYRDQFGFDARISAWSSNDSQNAGVPSAEIRSADITVPGTSLRWRFAEFKGVERKRYAPRVPDPGAPVIGLQVRDIDAAIAAVTAAGGSSITQGGSIKLGSGKVGFVRDPSGILVELAQP